MILLVGIYFEWNGTMSFVMSVVGLLARTETIGMCVINELVAPKCLHSSSCVVEVVLKLLPAGNLICKSGAGAGKWTHKVLWKAIRDGFLVAWHRVNMAGTNHTI
jgi:hypothetical protein